MMMSNLDDDGIHCQLPIRAQKRLSEPSSGEHNHLKQPKFTGSWDKRSGTWLNVRYGRFDLFLHCVWIQVNGDLT